MTIKNLHLALQPHHDGSALYVSPARPELEGKVKLKIRVHQSAGSVKRIMIRQSDSGEGFFSPELKKLYSRRGWDWYEGSITMYNPEIHYRFFIEFASGESY